MSPTLEATQRWMQEALVFPLRVAPEDVQERLASSAQLTGADGLAIYQRGYFLRITACMREQFPALCHALGEPLFNDFVAGYIQDHPPESHTLYDLGRRFPAFLEESRPDRDDPPEARETWIDFMIDLASFERAVFSLFDAPGWEGRPFADAATPPDRLRLQPAFALGAYRYPVAAYYHAVRQKQPAPLPPAQPCFVALVRTDYVTRTIPITEAEHRLLTAIAGGATATLRDPIQQRWLDWGFFIDEPPPALLEGPSRTGGRVV
ncbi:DNA-binding domain-containing protein [Caulobacter ginsengisoli]|uniref:DNA-binding domain-containing protein n=1 Tax=Caulobacter ginsengisoli TaxID=400775 RepID=UPI0027D7F549|nr:DNA-binding domain-containing protein [Caulobacter ginsengisoli]